MKNLDFQTLSQKAKKKKDFIIVTLIIGIVGFVFLSLGLAFMNNDSKQAFEEKKNIIEDKEFSIVKKHDFKENWAIAMENRIDQQAKKMDDFQEEVKEENKKNIEEIKNLILDANTMQNQKINELTENLNNQFQDFKNNVEAKFLEQQNQLEDVNLKINAFDLSSGNNFSDSTEVILGEDLLPRYIGDRAKDESVLGGGDASLGDVAMPSQNNVQPKKVERITKPKFSLKMVDVDTSSNQEQIKKEENLISELEKLKLKKNNSFHLMTGLTQAYMVTGAYAPVFDSGQEEPLPVLLQAEGDILIANDDTQTIDKCFLIGSAKGNMNSSTADIRLVKISCSLGEGTKKVEGNISGWVIGENGIPGVQGELLHKNGAWLSKTFVAGFLETFAGALGKTDSTEIVIGTDSNSKNKVGVGTAVSENAQSAAYGGLSSVFGRLGEYYLKMAENIFPVIEVKGGRTVNILLKGGESFTITDFNKLDLSSINDTIDDEKAFEEKVGTTEYLRMKKEIEDAEPKEAPIENPSYDGSKSSNNNNNSGFNLGNLGNMFNNKGGK